MREKRGQVELAERLPEHSRWMLGTDRVVRNREEHLALVAHGLLRSRLGHVDRIARQREPRVVRVCSIELARTPQ
jgi:hypothetical protein